MPVSRKDSEKPTDSAKRDDRRGKARLIAAYLAIWVFALLVFWLFGGRADALGYSVVFLWVVLPVTTLVCSLLIGRRNYWGKGKWFTALLFGVMYMLTQYATFSTANMIAFQHFNRPDIEMMVGGTILSVIGLGIGSLLRKAL
ncbi:MAG: hypothetical protein LUF28_02370 [Clostridiales bacterium]|nr:hypothetical protein [Clostridiales bacterium]